MRRLLASIVVRQLNTEGEIFNMEIGKSMVFAVVGNTGPPWAIGMDRGDSANFIRDPNS